MEYNLRENGAMLKDKPRILLIDLDDSRRSTRIQLHERAGYEIDLRADYVEAESVDDEDSYDLIVLSVHMLPDGAVEYSNRLAAKLPTLPILLVTDAGAFVPRGTLSRCIDCGEPVPLMATIASMLAGSTHIREVPTLS